MTDHRYARLPITAPTLAIAGELTRESSEHGAPWVSFGDVGFDGDNPVRVDRDATAYLTCDTPDGVPRALIVAPDVTLDARDLMAWGMEGRPVHGVTLPAYAVWFRARSAGLAAADYGRTWHVYASREEYEESLD